MKSERTSTLPPKSRKANGHKQQRMSDSDATRLLRKEPRPFGIGMGPLVLILWASRTAALGNRIQEQGLAHVLIQALAFAAILAAVLRITLWPLWLWTASPRVTMPLIRAPGAVIALAWPAAFGAIWLLDPDHGILHRYRLVTWPALPFEWAIILLTPILTLRWFKLRRARARLTNAVQ